MLGALNLCRSKMNNVGGSFFFLTFLVKWTRRISFINILRLSKKISTSWKIIPYHRIIFLNYVIKFISCN